MQDNKPITSDPHDALTASPKTPYIPPYVTKLTTNPNTSGKPSRYYSEVGSYDIS
jgi:hypothetical protein